MRKTTASVINLGCRVNRVESDKIAVGLISHGFELVDEDEAQLIVRPMWTRTPMPSLIYWDVIALESRYRTDATTVARIVLCGKREGPSVPFP